MKGLAPSLVATFASSFPSWVAAALRGRASVELAWPRSFTGSLAAAFSPNALSENTGFCTLVSRGARNRMGSSGGRAPWTRCAAMSPAIFCRRARDTSSSPLRSTSCLAVGPSDTCWESGGQVPVRPHAQTLSSKLPHYRPQHSQGSSARASWLCAEASPGGWRPLRRRAQRRLVAILRTRPACA
eukprot:scaffold636_cov252-Pinguiococcus_pyrenoidosus.AAC.16